LRRAFQRSARLDLDYVDLEHRFTQAKASEEIMKDLDLDKLFAEKRFCYFVPVDSYVKDHGFRPSIVFEGEPGHRPIGDWPFEGKPDQKMPWFWGHLYEEAEKTAEVMNESLGLSPTDVFAIVTSSMARKR
jgi:hypothetical protein